MNKYCKEINQSLNEEINELTTEIGNSLVLYEKIIDLIVKKIVQLKLSVLKHHEQSFTYRGLAFLLFNFKSNS